MAYIVIFLVIAVVACFAREMRDWHRRTDHKSALKSLLLLSGMFVLTECLSYTTTERPEHTVPVAAETRTETVYVNEDGTRVRRIVTVDSQGRRYYVENGRNIYVDRYEY